MADLALQFMDKSELVSPIWNYYLHIDILVPAGRNNFFYHYNPGFTICKTKNIYGLDLRCVLCENRCVLRDTPGTQRTLRTTTDTNKKKAAR